MSLASAYLLVAHGSSDPRPQIALERLGYLVAQNLNKPEIQHPVSSRNLVQSRARSAQPPADPMTIALLSRPNPTQVYTASLECQALPLHRQIGAIGAELGKRGYQTLKILPLFLLSGVHVQEDLPREVGLAQRELANQIRLAVFPYLGSQPALVKLISQQCLFSDSTVRILFAHGSRREGGNAPVEAIASACEAEVAYSAIFPDLATVVERVSLTNPRTIQIIPYLLFAGGLSDAIAAQVQGLQQQYPAINFCLAQPLGTNPALANIIAAQGE